MIVKRNFHPARVWAYIRRPMLFVIIWSTLVWILFAAGVRQIASISFVPVGVMGSALAIFVAFRNNSAYARWWEARTLWGGIVNSSRVLARLLITFTDSHAHQANYEKGRSERFKQEMVYACIAWAHALRLHLRRQSGRDEMQRLLPEQDFNELLRSQNLPNYLQLLMGRKIYEAMATGILAGFDSFQLEGQLLALANYQGSCERIKNTPLPRQYDFFTRLFVYAFATALPFGLINLMAGAGLQAQVWLAVPLSLAIAGMFVIMERTGAAVEDPFENKVTDVPLSALCTNIERDLREMLGERDLPPEPKPEKGYLF
jgi:ion channel-forming bestrophin family protein